MGSSELSTCKDTFIVGLKQSAMYLKSYSLGLFVVRTRKLHQMGGKIDTGLGARLINVVALLPLEHYRNLILSKLAVIELGL